MQIKLITAWKALQADSFKLKQRNNLTRTWPIRKHRKKWSRKISNKPENWETPEKQKNLKAVELIKLEDPVELEDHPRKTRILKI